MGKVGKFWIISLVSCGLSFCCTSAAWADPIREAIESQNQALIAAMLAGDAEAAGELYTEDAVVIPPGANLVRGRPSIVSFWAGFIGGGVKEMSLVTVSVESDGDLAHEVGALKLVDGEGNASEARYVVVWKREAGAWRLHRDIWNAP